MTEIPEKTLYDGRLLYHSRLNDLLKAKHRCSLEKDWEGWIDCINCWFTEICAYITKEQFNEIVKEIQILTEKITLMNSGNKFNPNSINSSSLKNQMYILERKMMIVSKKLYLPTEEFETEIDFDKIMKESD